MVRHPLIGGGKTSQDHTTHHASAIEDIQRSLSRLLIVYSALLDVLPGQNPADAAFHFRNTPFKEFAYQTLFEVVESGNEEGAAVIVMTKMWGISPHFERFSRWECVFRPIVTAHFGKP